MRYQLFGFNKIRNCGCPAPGTVFGFHFIGAVEFRRRPWYQLHLNEVSSLRILFLF